MALISIPVGMYTLGTTYVDFEILYEILPPLEGASKARPPYCKLSFNCLDARFNLIDLTMYDGYTVTSGTIRESVIEPATDSNYSIEVNLKLRSVDGLPLERNEYTLVISPPRVLLPTASVPEWVCSELISDVEYESRSNLIYCENSDLPEWGTITPGTVSYNENSVTLQCSNGLYKVLELWVNPNLSDNECSYQEYLNDYSSTRYSVPLPEEHDSEVEVKAYLCLYPYEENETIIPGETITSDNAYIYESQTFLISINQIIGKVKINDMWKPILKMYTKDTSGIFHEIKSIKGI
jgi:hypothetical protein